MKLKATSIFFFLILLSLATSQSFLGGKLKHLETGIIKAFPIDTDLYSRPQHSFSQTFLRDDIFDSSDVETFIATSLRDYHANGIRAISNSAQHIQVVRSRLNPGKNILTIDLNTNPAQVNPVPTRAKIYGITFNFIVIGAGFEGFYESPVESSYVFARNGQMNIISTNNQALYDFHNQYESSPFRYDPDPNIHKGCGAVKRNQWILEDGLLCDQFKMYAFLTGFEFGSHLPPTANKQQLYINFDVQSIVFSSNSTLDGIKFNFNYDNSWASSSVYRVQMSLIAVGIRQLSLPIYPQQIIYPNGFIYNQIPNTDSYSFVFTPASLTGSDSIGNTASILSGIYYQTTKNQISHLFCGYRKILLSHGIASPNQQIDFSIGQINVDSDKDFILQASANGGNFNSLAIQIVAQCVMFTKSTDNCEVKQVQIPLDVSQAPQIVANPETNTGSDILSQILPSTIYKEQYDPNFIQNLNLLIFQQKFIKPGTISYVFNYNQIESGKAYQGILHLASSTAPTYLSSLGQLSYFKQSIKITVFGQSVYREEFKISASNLPKTIHFSFIAPEAASSSVQIVYETDFSSTANGVTGQYINFMQFGIIEHQHVLGYSGECLTTCPKQPQYSTGIDYHFNPPVCVQCLKDLYFEFSPETGSCACKSGYVQKSGICEICPSKLCSTCNSVNNNCQFCVQNAKFINLMNPSLGCLCETGYFQADISCLSCPSGCIGCQNSQNCTQCRPNNNTRLNKSNACKCIPGYYETGLDDCLKCSPQCQTCQNSPTNCLTCNSDNKLQKKGSTCVCQKGYYKNIINNTAQCKPCDPGCSICSNSATCIECLPFRMKNSQNKCVCQSGYLQYEGSCLNILCKAIPFCQLCKILISTGENICTSCTSLRVPSSDYLKCVCKSGYYELGSQCLKCKDGCSKCQNPNKCLKCAEQAYSNNDGSCSCPQGNYIALKQNTLICRQCDSNCLKCYNSPSNCSQCTNGFLTVNYQCICPPGYYASMDNSRCLDCGKGCIDCKNGQCLKCTDHYFLSNGSCILQCPTGTYNDANQCRQCSEYCTNCLSSINCNSCFKGYYLFAGSCRQTCPASTYPFGTLCIACQQKCASCNQAQFCQTCKPGYILLNSKCLQNCPIGTYFYYDTCKPCNNTCLTCQNSSTCTSCKKSQFLINGQCSSSCPWVIVDGQCKKQCLNNQYKDENGVCQQCPSTCLTCSSQNYCQSCKTGFNFNGKCVTNCPTNSIQINNHCILCDASCQGCSGSPYSCIKCSNGYYQYLDRCIQKCPPKFYEDNVKRSCLQCDWGCTQCLGPGKCASCQNHQTPIAGICPQSCGAFCWDCQNNRCLKCMDGSILTGGQCIQKCPYGSTFNAGKCVCNSGVLHNQQCIPNCPSGYVSWDGICQKCAPNCHTCVNSANRCTSCKEGYILDQVLKECLFFVDCPYGYYSSTLGGCRLICPQNYYFHDSACYQSGCPTGFSIDYASRSCKKLDQVPGCTYPYILQGNKCQTSCNSGFYPDWQKRVCQPCFPNCLVCSSFSDCKYCQKGFTLIKGECVQSRACLSGSALYEGVCLSECPPGTALNKGFCERICRDNTYYWNGCCYLSCQTKLRTKEACVYACPKGFIQNKGICLFNSLSCPSGQYYDSYLNKCSPCRPPCSQCSGGATSCTSCQTGFYLLNGNCSSSSGVKCPQKCAYCIEPGRCGACASGYVNTGDDCVKNNNQLESVSLQQISKTIRSNTVFIEIRPSILPNNLPSSVASKFFIFSTDNPNANPTISQWINGRNVVVALSHGGTVPNYKAFFIPNSVLLSQIYLSLGYNLANTYISTDISQYLPSSLLNIPITAAKQTKQSLVSQDKPFNKHLNSITTNAMKQMSILLDRL